MAAACGYVGAALAIAVLLSHLGSLLWVFDLTANFRVQGTILLVVLGAVAVAGGTRRVGVAVLVVGLMSGSTLVPMLLGGGPGIAAASDRVTVMSFNVGISNPNRSAVADLIAAEDPDVVFIFESSFEWEDTIRSADLPLQIVSIVPRGRLAGVTVLARPEMRPRAIDVSLGGEAAAVEVDLGEGRIELLGVHPPSPTTPRRSDARDALLRRAAEWVAGRPGEVVVAGDLNATPWSHAFFDLRLRAGLTDSLVGAGFQPTWPDGWGLLMIPIDHVLHTPGLGTEGRRTGPALGSAHRPVIVDVGWRR